MTNNCKCTRSFLALVPLSLVSILRKHHATKPGSAKTRYLLLPSLSMKWKNPFYVYFIKNRTDEGRNRI